MYWSFDWSWGLPLLVFTVVIHVCAFVLMVKALVRKVRPGKGVCTLGHFIVAIALTALGAAALHGLEAAAWAIVYIWVGALPDAHAALLYSLGAITSYGHSNIFLEDRWRLLGAIEAMNGLILFGLTTAFLFAAIEEVWPVRRGQFTPSLHPCKRTPSLGTCLHFRVHAHHHDRTVLEDVPHGRGD